MTEIMTKGIITRVNGPIVEARDMERAGMLEVVEVGEERLIGEVIRIRGGGIATIQVYENTSGLKPGEGVYCTTRPLSVELGPGLLGTIYDGIQRPLDRIAAISGAMIHRGEKTDAQDLDKIWHFVPSVKEGDIVKPGVQYGEVQETPSVLLKLITPPTFKPGRVKSMKPEGDYNGRTVLAEVEYDDGSTKPLGFYQYWPVRTPRPVLSRKPLEAPLLTGLRVIDTFFPIAKGGAAAIPGGFGTGKTMTQQALAKWSDADIIVYRSRWTGR